MKSVILAIAAVASLVATHHAFAQAVCPTGTTPATALGNLVGGKTMCAARAGERWQEFHQGNGNGGSLIDWKLGPGHAVDPTETVGTWSASNGDSLLTHAYTGGSSFTWLVCINGGVLTLVSTGSAGTVSGVTLLNGQVQCP